MISDDYQPHLPTPYPPFHDNSAAALHPEHHINTPRSMDSADSSPAESSKQNRARIPRPRTACTICRSLKTRCLPETADAPPESRCSRCARLNLDCQYYRAKRGPPKGRKRNVDPNAGPSSNGSADQRVVRQRIDNGSHHGPAPHLLSPHEPHFDTKPMHDRHNPNSSISPNNLPPLPPHQNLPHPSHLNLPKPPILTAHPGHPPQHPSAPPPAYWDHPSAETVISAAPSSQPSSRAYDPVGPYRRPPSPAAPPFRPFTLALGPSPNQERNNVTLENALEPVKDTNSGRQSVDNDRASDGIAGPAPRCGATIVHYPDPVSTGLFTELEARALFKQFEERVSPSSHIFDPYFHTYERVRASPVLFNAVMYATCRFMRPELSEQCLDLTETVIARMMRLGAATIPLVQAILALVYWKKPKDRTAFVKLGTAVRLIQQMRVAWPTEPQTYASEEQERAAVDVERTIYNVYGMEWSYSGMFRLQYMSGSPVPDGPTLKAWAKQHRHLDVAGDYFKAFMNDLRHLHSCYPYPPPADHPHIHTDYDNVVGLTVYSQMVDDWMREPNLRGVYRLLSGMLGKTLVLKLQAGGLKYNATSVEDVLGLAEEIGVVIRDIVAGGEPVYWSDMSCTMLSGMGTLMWAARDAFRLEDLARVERLCKDVTAAFETLPEHLIADHALSYNKRLYSRLGAAFDRLCQGARESQNDIMLQLNQLLSGGWSATSNANAPMLFNDMMPDPSQDWNWTFPVTLS